MPTNPYLKPLRAELGVVVAHRRVQAFEAELRRSQPKRTPGPEARLTLDRQKAAHVRISNLLGCNRNSASQLMKLLFETRGLFTSRADARVYFGSVVERLCPGLDEVHHRQLLNALVRIATDQK